MSDTESTPTCLSIGVWYGLETHGERLGVNSMICNGRYFISKSDPQFVELDADFTDFEDGFIYLYHYSKVRFEELPKEMTYWSGCLTDFPQIAGPVTGLPNSCCQWRLAWTFPAKDFERNIKEGDIRWLQIRGFAEYQNKVIPRREQLSWEKMRDETSPSMLPQLLRQPP